MIFHPTMQKNSNLSKNNSLTISKKSKTKKFIPGKSKIRYAGMVFDKNEIDAAVNSLLSSFSNNWFALGKNAVKFQNTFASKLDVEKAIFVNSGSSANLVAVATTSCTTSSPPSILSTASSYRASTEVDFAFQGV